MNLTGIRILMFMGVLLFVAATVSGLITVRVTALHSVPMWGKILIFLGIGLAFLSPFLLRDTAIPAAGPAYIGATYAAYFVFVMVFLFFSFMLIRDFAWFGMKSFFPKVVSPFDAAAVLKANLILLGIVVAISAWSLYAGTRVPAVREVTLTSDKVTKPLTIAVLPDVHIHRALARAKVQGIVDKTNALKPDMIALPGDIIDDRAAQIRDFLPILAELKAPLGVFVTDGNHEIYMGPESAHRQFAEAGLTYLRNEARWVADGIVVAGVPDTQSARIGHAPNPAKTLADVEDSDFVLLLAHTPKIFDMVGNIADVQVSGHTHGGQIFPFHFLAKLANKYLAGVYRDKDRTLYVSRGAGQWGPQMRFLAPSEITLIRVEPKE